MTYHKAIVFVSYDITFSNFSKLFQEIFQFNPGASTWKVPDEQLFGHICDFKFWNNNDILRCMKFKPSHSITADQYATCKLL